VQLAAALGETMELEQQQQAHGLVPHVPVMPSAMNPLDKRQQKQEQQQRRRQQQQQRRPHCRASAAARNSSYL